MFSMINNIALSDASGDLPIVQNCEAHLQLLGNYPSLIEVYSNSCAADHMAVSDWDRDRDTGYSRLAPIPEPQLRPRL